MNHVFASDRVIHIKELKKYDDNYFIQQKQWDANLAQIASSFFAFFGVHILNFDSRYK